MSGTTMYAVWVVHGGWPSEVVVVKSKEDDAAKGFERFVAGSKIEHEAQRLSKLRPPPPLMGLFIPIKAFAITLLPLCHSPPFLLCPCLDSRGYTPSCPSSSST